jgi:hypothetical protein
MASTNPRPNFQKRRHSSIICGKGSSRSGRPKRCWVFQEILLANDNVLRCGQERLEWSTFVDSCADLDGGIEGRNLSMYNLCQDVVLDVENLRERFWSTQVRSTLSKILSDTWYRKATLPEDQIFSVLGFVKGTVLQEDYSLSIHDTCMAAARICILQHRHLGILCLAELSRTPGDIAADLPKRAKLELPSWVLRWGSFGQHIRLRGKPLISGFGTLSRSFGAIRTLLRDPNNLMLQGFAVGNLSAAMELRQFVRCAPCKTNQSPHMDQMLLLEHPRGSSRRCV